MSLATRLSELATRATHRTFAEAVTVTVGGTDYEIDGVFDEAGQRTDVATGAVIDTQPQVSIRASDIDDIEITTGTDTVTARGRSYTVEQVYPDGTGNLRLILMGA